VTTKQSFALLSWGGKMHEKRLFLREFPCALQVGFMLAINVGVNGFFVLKDFAAFRAHVLPGFCFRGDFALSHLTHQFISFKNKEDNKA
jgi:hypothetical protein